MTKQIPVPARKKIPFRSIKLRFKTKNIAGSNNGEKKNNQAEPM